MKNKQNVLNYYINLWELRDCCAITSTLTSNLYKANSKHGNVVLKILSDVGRKDELTGITFLINCNGNGAAKLFEYDDHALLMEYLPGKNIYQFSKSGDEKKACEIFCDIIKKIQAINYIKYRDKLTSYTKLFEIFDKISTPTELKVHFSNAHELSKELISTQTNEVLLHGDLHHENVLSRSSGEFVCFDPKGLVGDPSYEIATILKNPWNHPEISQDIRHFMERANYFARELNLPLNRIIKFSYLHLCLSIAWSIEDGQEYTYQKKILSEIYEKLGEFI